MRRLATIALILIAAGCGDPEKTPEVVPTVFDDGEACRMDRACAGETCLGPLFGYPDGHCTTVGCDTDDDCSTDNGICLVTAIDLSACFTRCDDDSSCRSGYDCLPVGDGLACVPGGSDLPDLNPPTVTFDQTKQALGIDCNPTALEEPNTFAFDFSIGAEAEAFTLVPYVENGTLKPLTMTTPNAEVDFADYRHHNTRIEDILTPPFGPYGAFATIAFDWPIMVPFAPQYDFLVTEGDYSLTLTTDGASPCFYLIESTSGTAVDLDIYLVGETGIAPERAAEDPDLSAMLEAAESLLEPAGISLGEVSYKEVSAEVSQRFSIVRDLTDIDLLTATGQPRSPTLQGHLKVNVFIVETIIFDGITALGVSASVPGSPGMHGNTRNGLVFGSIGLGDSNDLVGQVLAHELGHYLGLRHTTEILNGQGDDAEELMEERFGTTDPIDDTPVCANVSNLFSNCPDYANLMFPVVQNPDDGVVPVLTEGQSTTLQKSALVK